MSFDSNTNKALLWNLMQEGGVFTHIPNKEFSKVKEIFENKIALWKNKDGSILEKNKQAIMEMIRELEYLRTKPTLVNNQNGVSRNYDVPVTKKDIQNKRRESFNNNLEKRQSEFNDMMTVKKPSELDFSDSPDEKPIGSEMDQLLADMIAKRDLQLSNATSNLDTSKAQEWISKDNKNPDNFNNSIATSGPPTLKIGESLQLPDNTVVENIRIDVKDELNSRKRVTFLDQETNDSMEVDKKENVISFMNKFKKTARDNKEIIEEIKTLRTEITSKLSKIDELLVELS